ncbi:MAG: hypothetical protein COU72_05165 [Parcubacteria group bacterium CG10_big_fil_rev_8_21_14_0_10_41_35]|nr:MAG: hypothetical protein COU72_05165 [Parcubacteria group bacterium CG10_big_fil_rev_8_21_14_0_10_41_35]
MIKFVLFLMLAAPAMADTCTVQTFAADGMYLSAVATADGQSLTCREAIHIAELLNQRHNNGVNPVVARVFKGE